MASRDAREGIVDSPQTGVSCATRIEPVPTPLGSLHCTTLHCAQVRGITSYSLQQVGIEDLRVPRANCLALAVGRSLGTGRRRV